MKTHHRLPDGELEIMQIIWKNAPPVSRSVIEKALNREKSLAPSTIITFLSRLCDKGFLQVEHQGRTNLYTPLIDQKDYLAGESRRFLDRVYGGSVSAFAASLCDSGLTAEDARALRKLLEDNAL